MIKPLSDLIENVRGTTLPTMREGVKKRSIRAIIKPIGRMTRYILKTLNYDEDRDVDYGIPGEDPGFVDDEQWAELKSYVKATLSEIPKAARADAMYDEIMTNIQKPRLHRTEIADFASAFDEYFIGLKAMVRDGDLK
jgi:lysyl-tRNA synthetase class I